MFDFPKWGNQKKEEMIEGHRKHLTKIEYNVL